MSEATPVYSAAEYTLDIAEFSKFLRRELKTLSKETPPQDLWVVLNAYTSLMVAAVREAYK